MTTYSRSMDDANDPSDQKTSNRQDTLNYVAHNNKGEAIALAKVSRLPSKSLTQETDFHTGKPIVDMEMTDVDTPINRFNMDSTPFTRPADEDEQLVMFSNRHVPEERILQSLYAKKGLGGQTAAMNLIGIADNASTLANGRHIKPSGNLSSHSQKLVEHLHASGHISDEDMPAMDHNRHSFSHSDSFLAKEHKSNIALFQHLEDLSSRVPAAKEHVRNLISNRLGPQFTQPQLEGFE